MRASYCATGQHKSTTKRLVFFSKYLFYFNSTLPLRVDQDVLYARVSLHVLDVRTRGFQIGGFEPLKICRRGQSMLWPPKMSHSFVQNCCWITLRVLHHQGLCQKWKVKLIFQGDYRLSGTGIVECLEIIDVGCIWWNSLMAWPDWPWPPYFTTVLRHWFARQCKRT